MLLPCMQVPTDSELLLAALKVERRAKLAIPQLPSTFSADIAAITGATIVTMLFQVPWVAGSYITQACGPEGASDKSRKSKGFPDPGVADLRGLGIKVEVVMSELRVVVVTGSPGTSAGSSASEQSRFGADESDGYPCTPESRWPWPKKLSQLLSACSGSLGEHPTLHICYSTAIATSPFHWPSALSMWPQYLAPCTFLPVWRPQTTPCMEDAQMLDT